MKAGSRTRSGNHARARRMPPRPPKGTKSAKRTPKGAATIGANRVPFPRVAEPMWALVYDVEKDKWDKTRGFRKIRWPARASTRRIRMTRTR